MGLLSRLVVHYFSAPRPRVIHHFRGLSTHISTQSYSDVLRAAGWQNAIQRQDLYTQKATCPHFWAIYPRKPCNFGVCSQDCLWLHVAGGHWLAWYKVCIPAVRRCACIVIACLNRRRRMREGYDGLSTTPVDNSPICGKVRLFLRTLRTLRTFMARMPARPAHAQSHQMRSRRERLPARLSSATEEAPAGRQVVPSRR